MKTQLRAVCLKTILSAVLEPNSLPKSIAIYRVRCLLAFGIIPLRWRKYTLSCAEANILHDPIDPSIMPRLAHDVDI